MPFSFNNGNNSNSRRELPSPDPTVRGDTTLEYQPQGGDDRRAGDVRRQGYAELDPEANGSLPSSSPRSPKEKEAATPLSNFEALKKIIFGSPVNVLLLIVPLSVAAPQMDWSDEVVFSVCFAGILPLAGLLGAATEELAANVGETIGGLLNATFGNAVEMILSVYALREGLTEVVQGSLLGSILSNLLLVLGMCFAFGGVKYRTMRFNADGARAQSSLLLLAVLAMIVPSLSALNPEGRDEAHEERDILLVSRGAAIILTCLYCSYLFFQLGTHPEHFQTHDEEEEEEEEGHMNSCMATLLLALTTVLVAICSEGLVGSVEGMTESLGVSKAFVGVILLSIVGNAAEHLTAVTCALKNKLDLALGVALGSSTQIALFVVPFTVLVGWGIDVPMDLNFKPLSTGILLLTVLIVGSLTNDGESNWMEGTMLLAAYLLIAMTFYFMT